MQRLIDDANKLREAQGESADLTIDSYADVVEAIHTVQDNMGITGTTAKEAATTISGSVGMAKAAWQNFLVGLGRDDADFSALTNQLLEAIGAVAQNVAPRVAQIGQGIISAFPTVLAGLGEVLAPLVADALSSAWGIAATALSGVGIQLPSVDSSQFMEAFQQVADLVGQVVDGIKSAFGTVAETMAPAVAALFSALSPIIGQVASTLMPALSALGSALGGLAAAVLPVISAAVQAVAPVIGQIISVVVQLAAQIASGLAPIIQNIAAIVQAVLPAAQAMFQTFATAVQGVISAVFPFIQSVIQTAMSVISAVISTVLAAINGDWGGVWNGIKSIASSVWNGIGSIVSTGVNAVLGVISSVLGAIKGVWDSAWSGIKGAFSGIWNGIKSAAQSGIDGVLGVVSGVKDKITGFFSGAGSWLANAGSSIMNGLRDGIMGAVGSVTSSVSSAVGKIRDLFPFSPAKTGPFSGHGYTTWSGKALMEDWGASIEGAAPKAADYAARAVSGVQAAISAARVSGAGGDFGAAYDVSGGSDSSDVIAWLERNLGPIISKYSPTMGQRDFVRAVNKAVTMSA